MCTLDVHIYYPRIKITRFSRHSLLLVTLDTFWHLCVIFLPCLSAHNLTCLTIFWAESAVWYSLINERRAPAQMLNTATIRPAWAVAVDPQMRPAASLHDGGLPSRPRDGVLTAITFLFQREDGNQQRRLCHRRWGTCILAAVFCDLFNCFCVCAKWNWLVYKTRCSLFVPPALIKGEDSLLCWWLVETTGCISTPHSQEKKRFIFNQH